MLPKKQAKRKENWTMLDSVLHTAPWPRKVADSQTKHRKTNSLTRKVLSSEKNRQNWVAPSRS
jgi:hypothetical protein